MSVEENIEVKESALKPSDVGEKVLGSENWQNELYRDLFEGELWATNLQDMTESESSEVLDKVIGEREITAEDKFKRLRAFEYIVAYKYIKNENMNNGWGSMSQNERHGVMREQNITLNEFHKKIDDSISIAIEGNDGLVDKFNHSREQSSSQVSNVKVFRGLHCNAACIFCFQEQSMDPQVQAFVDGHRRLTFTQDQLTRALLFSRAAAQVREVNFSGGESLANIPKDLPRDINVARDLGFAQITMMSNGRLLNKERIEQLIDSGLTNLTVSIHTVDPITHFRILNWKDKGRVFDPRNFEGGNEATTLAINKVRSDYDAQWEEEFEGTVDPEIEQGVRDQIESEIEDRYVAILSNVREAVKSGEGKGLRVRFNVAYAPENMGTDVKGMVEFAESIGVQELTLISMIPGNEEAKRLREELPADSEFEEMGFEVPKGGDSKNWGVGGIKIYRPGEERKISVAACDFGTLNQVGFEDEEYATFKGQSKELVLHNLPQVNGGVLGTETYEVTPDSLLMYLANP